VAAVKQYQVVIFRSHHRIRDDEEALTDILNERARAGWTLDHTSQISDTRLMLVFVRQT
jgi:hypothetical protein